MQEKKLYIIAMIGALICFTGDILLGFFTPASDFMNKYVAIMFICVILSKLLPQTSFVNGVVSMGQQSIGFFIVFLALLITCGNLRGGE